MEGMDPSGHGAPGGKVPEYKPEISLAGLARSIRRWRRPFLVLSLGLPFVTAVVLLFTSNKFTAHGTILVETPESQVTPDLLGQLTSLIGPSIQGLPTDLYIAILRSDRVEIAVADSLKLVEHYGIDADSPEQAMEITLNRMHRRVHFDSPDAVSIVISATDPDPEMASHIVNGFLDQLELASQTLALSRARRTRYLVSDALKETEAELDSTRRRLQVFQETYGIFSIEKQTEGTLDLIGNLQTELLAAKAQRDQMGGFTSEGSAQMRNLNLKIGALETQIRQLVMGNIQVMVKKDAPRPAGGQPPAESEGARSTESFFLPLSRIPRLAGRYADIYMDLKVQEAKYNILATQLEQTKIEESQSIPSFEVLDRGRRPFRKSGPMRKLYVMAALVAGLMGGVLLCVLLDDIAYRVDEPTRRELATLVPGFVKRRFRR
jgi:uncharacterized protein involved in exopolysaccharide biosynthesis